MSHSAGLVIMAASDQGSMSFADRVLLWFHVAFVVFTVGPVTLAVMSSPRAIRTGNATLLRYLLWMTRVFGAATLGVFAFGMMLGQSLNELGEAWLTVSMTLYVVAAAVLVLITRDQRRAVAALEAAAKAESAPAVALGEPAGAGQETPNAPAQPTRMAAAAHAATVERGRIASLGGIVSIIWLVILALMISNG